MEITRVTATKLTSSNSYSDCRSFAFLDSEPSIGIASSPASLSAVHPLSEFEHPLKFLLLFARLDVNTVPMPLPVLEMPNVVVSRLIASSAVAMKLATRELALLYLT